MDDVLGDVVFAPGDEDLRPEQAIVVAVGLCPGADGRQIRTRLRFGQVHRSGPRAGNHLRQEALLEFVGGVMRQRLHRAHGQHLAQRERQVGRFPHFGHGARHQSGHALATDVGACGHPVPSGFGELRERLREAVRRADLAGLPAASLAIAGRVQRRQHFGRETTRLGEDRLHQLRFGLLESLETGDFGKPCQMLEDKPHVVQRGGIGHDAFSTSFASSCNRNGPCRARAAPVRKASLWRLSGPLPRRLH